MTLDHGTDARAAFRNPHLQQRYEQDGYVTFPMLARDDLEALVELARGAYPNPTGFISSAIDRDHVKRRRIAEAVIEICAPSVERAMIGQRVVMGGVLIKTPNDPQAALDPHLDWSTVDELEAAAAQAWIPLVDTDPRSGGLFILPRSSKLVDTPRGSPTYFPNAFDHLAPDQIRRYGRFLCMRAGEALAMDQRSVHWSPVNRSAEPRLAVALLIVPEGVGLRHYFGRADGTFHVYEVNDEFFRTVDLSDDDLDGVPHGRYLRPLDVRPRRVDEETVHHVCAPEMALGRRPLPPAGNPRGERRTLLSLEQQTALDDDGFVKVPFLGPEELDALSSVCDEARSHGNSSYDSSRDPDTERRRHLSERIVEVCAPAVERLYVDHQILIGSVYVKPPGPEGAVPPRIDWTVVDEPSLISCQAWIAIGETSAAWGSLHLLPRSHRLVDTPRGAPDLRTPFDSLELEQLEQLACKVALRSGEAVIWDQRVLHWSPAIPAAGPQLAVGITLVPRMATLQHFCMAADMRVHQYIVDAGFFMSHQPGQEPDGEDLGPILFDPPQITVEELQRLFPPPPVSAGRRALQTIHRQVPSRVKRRIPPAVAHQLRRAADRLIPGASA